MSADSTNLRTLLQAELGTLKALHEALSSEYQALTSNAVDELEVAIAAKNDAVAAHQSQQQQRLAWMRGLGLGAESSLSDLIAHCKGDKSDEQLRDELAEIATQCQESNRRNGGLILRLQERTRGALDVLRQEDGGTDLYSLSGSREHQSDGRTLGKA
ncbi:flagella synthesis protein FlgN [Congregibacter sp.]|uniref:flagella synthesis protein FlgN n=1 Tax=Congregibacter sp. TaxID=2744308 RepID=UPI0038596AB0